MKKAKNKQSNREWEGPCDCPICRAMESGEADTMEGLLKAFAEAEKQGQGKIVSGSGHFNPGPRIAMRAPNQDDLYYDAMDALVADDCLVAEKLLLQALALDPDYVQTYVGLVSVYNELGDRQKVHENTKIAFEKTLKKFPKWPKKMSWYDTGNRAYFRAIQFRADLYAEAGDTEKAIELYKLLLKLNPNDNQGVRYLLAGLYAGIVGDDMAKMFEQGNEGQDWNKLEKIVKEQNKKHKFWKEPKDLDF